MTLSMALGVVLAVYAGTYLPDMVGYLRSLRPRRPAAPSQNDLHGGPASG